MISVVLILFTTVVFIANSSTQCDSSQTQLFYEDATNFTDWTLDADGSLYFDYFPEADHYCVDGGCYTMGELDYYSEIQTPNFVSELIPTTGYEDITITYALAQISFNYSRQDPSNELGECGTSYTVNGQVFTPIDLKISDPGLIIPAITNDWSDIWPSLYDTVTAPLGDDASNTTTLQIRWEKTSLLPFDTIISNQHYCTIDEIRVCGTAITPSPTTSSPTTPSPTRDSDSDSGNSGSNSDSGNSGSNSDNDSSDETAAALFNENKQLKYGDNNSVSDNNTATLSLNFSQETLMNFYILFAALTVANVICCVVCIKRNKGVTRVIKGSSVADNVYV